jgi:hypothetical protein
MRRRPGPDLASPPIACALEPDAAREQVDDWRSVLRFVSARDRIPNGVRLRVGADLALDAVARLAIAEHACCPFLTFTVIGHGRSVTLEVTAPADAQSLVADLFGSPDPEISRGR